MKITESRLISFKKFYEENFEFFKDKKPDEQCWICGWWSRLLRELKEFDI